MNPSRSTTMRTPASRETGETAPARPIDAAELPDVDTPPGSEHVVLIEFRWRSPLGVQPVLLVDRHHLH